MSGHKNNSQQSDPSRRRFLTTVSSAMGAIGVVGAAIPFVSSMGPSERAKAAGAPVEVDLSKLAQGQMVRVEWRGKPVYVLHRTQEMLDGLKDISSYLLDPESSEEDQQPSYAVNEHRSLKPDYLVMIGICTHLGCAPVDNFQVGPESGLGNDWKGGFFCPCHGSKFDLSGRVYSNVPAGENMAIPPYKYLSESKILIGENPEGVS